MSYQPPPYGSYPNPGNGYSLQSDLGGQPGGFVMPVPQVDMQQQSTADRLPYAPDVNSSYPNPTGGGYSLPPASAMYPPPAVPSSVGTAMPTISHAPNPPVHYLGVPIAGVPVNDHHLKSIIKKLKKGTKGYGTDEEKLIGAVVNLDAMQVEALKKKYPEETGKELLEVIEKETSSYFRMGLQGIIHGPLGWDAVLVQQALSDPKAFGGLANEIFLGRTKEEMQLLKQEFLQRSKANLEGAARLIASEASVAILYILSINSDRMSDHLPVNETLVQADVVELHKLASSHQGNTLAEYLKIFVDRSQPHLYAIINLYERAHSQKLKKKIKNEFSGPENALLKDALMYILEGVKHNDGGVKRDAKLLEKAMAGFGTKDKQLVWRIVRAHWNTPRMGAIKKAYEAKYDKTLASRVQGETSGDYRKLMLAIIGS